MPKDSAMTLETARRGDFITARHGWLNIAHIVAGHALLCGLFYALTYVPLWAGLPLAATASWIHQRFLSEWAHEAAHYNLAPDKKWNDILANWLLTFWHGYKIDAYRAMHMRHHSADEYFAAGDPDSERLAVKTRRDLALALLQDISGYTAVMAYLDVIFKRPATGGKNAGFSPLALVKFFLPIATLHLFFLAASFAGGFLAYYFCYMICLVTLYALFGRIRIYGQHLGVAESGLVLADHTHAARTIDAGLLDRIFFTSRLMMYHHEHHAKPALPYRALIKVFLPSPDPNAYMDARWPLLFKFLRSLP